MMYIFYTLNNIEQSYKNVKVNVIFFSRLYDHFIFRTAFNINYC